MEPERERETIINNGGAGGGGRGGGTMAAVLAAVAVVLLLLVFFGGDWFGGSAPTDVTQTPSGTVETPASPDVAAPAPGTAPAEPDADLQTGSTSSD